MAGHRIVAELERSLDAAASNIEKALLAAVADGVIDESEEQDIAAALNDVEKAVELQILAARSASLASMAAGQRGLSQTERESTVGAVRSIRQLVNKVVGHLERTAKVATESSSSEPPPCPRH